MSGLEIAGVVLAVIPVFQIALRRFQGDKSKTLNKYRHIIGDVSRRLDLEHAQLHSTFSRLLSLVLEEDRVAEILAGPADLAWKDERLVNMIREHLGEDKFALCTETLQDLAQCVTSLREELGLAGIVSLTLGEALSCH